MGATRAGNNERRDHYFGNLDPFRLVACNEFTRPMTPEKIFCRMDPYDNQNGEAEFFDANVFYGDRTSGRTVISAQEIE